MVTQAVVLLSPNVHARGALHQQAFEPPTVDNDLLRLKPISRVADKIFIV